MFNLRNLFSRKPVSVSNEEPEKWVESLEKLHNAALTYFRRADMAGVGTLQINACDVPRTDILDAIASSGIAPIPSPFTWITTTDLTYPTVNGDMAIFSHAGGPALFPNAQVSHKNHEDMSVDIPEIVMSEEDSEKFVNACLEIFNDPNYRAFLRGDNPDWVAPPFIAFTTAPHVYADLQNTVLNIVNTIKVIEGKKGHISGVILNMTIPVYILDETIRMIHKAFPHLQGNVHIILGSGFWRRHLA